MVPRRHADFLYHSHYRLPATDLAERVASWFEAMATAVKVFSLVVKQLSKPVAKILVDHAKTTARHSPDALLCRAMAKIGRTKHALELRVQASYAGVSNVKVTGLVSCRLSVGGAQLISCYLRLATGLIFLRPCVSTVQRN